MKPLKRFVTLGGDPGHRAEAAVLMRSLRVFDQAIVQLRAVGKVGYELKTVETVFPILACFGHRAEAAVLMRSLRVTNGTQNPLRTHRESRRFSELESFGLQL